MSPATRALLLAAFILPCAMPVVAHAQDPVPDVQRPTSELITREQIVGQKYQNAYDAVEGIHSNWLSTPMLAPTPGQQKDTSGKAQYASEFTGGRSRAGENGGIQVYLDGSRIGGIAELRSISSATIYSIRRIRGTDAQARWGIGHGAGVLYVLSLAHKDTKSP
ncbi:MAG: hypothetical protein ABJE47_20885 [bacterium]